MQNNVIKVKVHRKKKNNLIDMNVCGAYDLVVPRALVMDSKRTRRMVGLDINIV